MMKISCPYCGKDLKEGDDFDSAPSPVPGVAATSDDENKVAILNPCGSKYTKWVDAPASDILDEQEFYEICYQYRHAPFIDDEEVVRNFKAIKTYVRKNFEPVSRVAATTARFNWFENHGDEEGNNGYTIIHGEVDDLDHVIVATQDTEEEAVESCKRLNEIFGGLEGELAALKARAYDYEKQITELVEALDSIASGQRTGYAQKVLDKHKEGLYSYRADKGGLNQ